MRDPKVCSLYQPMSVVPPISAQEAVGMQMGGGGGHANGDGDQNLFREPSSNSGSDADWEPEGPTPRQRSTVEDSKLRVRERGKATQWKLRQKYKVGSWEGMQEISHNIWACEIAEKECSPPPLPSLLSTYLNVRNCNTLLLPSPLPPYSHLSISSRGGGGLLQRRGGRRWKASCTELQCLYHRRQQCC